MSVKPRLIVRRHDKARSVDAAPIEGKELKIGRDPGNNLLLNDPAVSPVHAIIRLEKDKLWLFDVFDTNATLLNGSIIAEAQLFDEDVVRIGPYSLLVDSVGDDFVITVERELKVVPAKAPVNLPARRAACLRRPVRLAGIKDEEKKILVAIKETRKREAGKVAPKTPLHPEEEYKTGKLRYKWRATSDLKPARRMFHLSWTALVVLAASLFGLYVYNDMYSPAPISAAHAAREMTASTIALRACSNSCSNCHKVFGNMQDSCSACHDVARKSVGATSGFDPAISTAHQRANIGCVGCHIEHRGASFKPGAVDNHTCASCHNDQYKYNGKVLGAPHKKGSEQERFIRKGDTVKWKAFTGKDAVYRFHVDHPYAREKCSYCHFGQRGTQDWNRSPLNSCDTCHAVALTATGLAPTGPNCATCHKQHGKSKDFRAAIDSISNDERDRLLAGFQSGELENRPDLTEGFAVGSIGGASVGRQGSSVFGLGLSKDFVIWLAIIVILPLAGAVMMAGSYRFRVRGKLIANGIRRRFSEAEIKEQADRQDKKIIDDRKAAKDTGAVYPHPKIDKDKCIGCYACIEACPQDVLAMSFDGIATPIALDQCMDDTSCQVVCPTGACVVQNTQKNIPERERPERDPKTYMTNVSGLHVVGDLSRTPLIKNAIDEGNRVIDYIEKMTGSESRPEYDVVIIGGGPAGLSSAMAAEKKNLKYLLIEQNTILSTIQSYPGKKPITFNPDKKKVAGHLYIPRGVRRRTKEAIVLLWSSIVNKSGIKIHEKESCKEIKKDDDLFTVTTEKINTGEKCRYTARHVILATGSSGMPKKLDKTCAHCSAVWRPEQAAQSGLSFMTRPFRISRRNTGKVLCSNCGKEMPTAEAEARKEDKIKYKLSHPDHFENKRCLVIGAGNTAVEAAVALAGLERDGDEIKFTRSNDVSLVIRSDFKSDLKFINKMNVYDCKDAGRIKIYFQMEVKEIKEDEVVLMNNKKEVKERIPNDYVFVLIGSEWPRKFLTDSGIRIITGKELAQQSM